MDDHQHCIYCDRDVPIINQDTRHMGEPCEVIPPEDDDEGWAALAEHHDPKCEWAVTRAHQRETVTTVEAAQILGVTDARIRQLVLDGAIKARKAGRDHMVNISSLLDWRPAKRGPKPS
jgi:excisionase family DNA binding protein